MKTDILMTWRHMTPHNKLWIDDKCVCLDPSKTYLTKDGKCYEVRGVSVLSELIDTCVKNDSLPEVKS